MAMKAKEVAEILGISQATLSLVVNNRPGISAHTRQKVLSELKARGFDYLINETSEETEAEGTGGNSKVIAFVNYRVNGELLEFDSFFPLIINNLERRARKYGYNLSYINVSRFDIENGICNIKASECSGYVIFATEMKEQDMQPFLNLKIPFVLLDNRFNGQDINVVKVNNEQGTYIGVEHLWKKGHRKMGYLRSGVDIDSFDERCMFALKAMHEFGAENPEKYLYTIGYPMEPAYEGMKKLLERNPELPTAFMVDNDLVAAGAMKALKEAGYRVPEDVSFVGFDDRPICFLMEPQLTTVQLPREYFGAEAVEILIRMLNGETDINLKVEVNSKLIERESVAER